ncbi:hypothetical protein MMC22_010024 [Lobaria immixta]|nr:hypothetical protein [Lobaria immixta]
MLSNPSALPPIARPSTASKRSRANSIDVRLSIIEEDGVPPPPPPKAHNRPFSRRWNIGDPPRASYENPPPKYSPWVATGPKGEKLWEVRNNKYIASRGGWKRICLVGFVVVAILVALIVGLVLGLKKSKTISNPPETLPSNSSSPSSPSTTAPFPAGSYTFTTYLDAVATNCTSVSADWQCAPYRTYSDSPSQALAIYQWIITDSGSPSSPNLTISSSNNPFNVEFANVSLALVDPDLNSEQYTFTSHFNKVVIPSPGLYCYFNNTVVEGTLYTKRAKSGPPAMSGSSTASAAQPTARKDVASDTFEEWKYAVQTTHSIGGGSTVPECFHMNNGVRGERVSDGIKPQAPDDMCSCVYQNYDL